MQTSKYHFVNSDSTFLLTHHDPFLFQFHNLHVYWYVRMNDESINKLQWVESHMKIGSRIMHYKFHSWNKNSHQHPFSNISLLSISHSCPLDFVRVHDGSDNTSAVIGTYCGQQRNLVLYSSESNLFVQFSTLQRTANTQNRGFKGIFEFSESFVKLDFIRELLLPTA